MGLVCLVVPGSVQQQQDCVVSVKRSRFHQVKRSIGVTAWTCSHSLSSQHREGLFSTETACSTQKACSRQKQLVQHKKGLFSTATACSTQRQYIQHTKSTFKTGPGCPAQKHLVQRRETLFSSGQRKLIWKPFQLKGKNKTL